MRSVDELVADAESAWPGIAAAADRAGPSVSVLEVNATSAWMCLHRLQVTTRSALGALAFHSGGITVDGGWLRILGGGHPPLPDLANVNRLGEPDPTSSSPPLLEVARDVLGGRFAVNGGGLPGTAGEVSYFAPDTLRWEPLGMGHSEFIAWALSGRTTAFYDKQRWPGWAQEVAKLGLDEGLSIYAPLFTTQGRDIASTSRRPVAWSELRAFTDDMQQQMAAIPDGKPFVLRISDE